MLSKRKMLLINVSSFFPLSSSTIIWAFCYHRHWSQIVLLIGVILIIKEWIHWDKHFYLWFDLLRMNILLIISLTSCVWTQSLKGPNLQDFIGRSYQKLQFQNATSFSTKNIEDKSFKNFHSNIFHTAMTSHWK